MCLSCSMVRVLKMSVTHKNVWDYSAHILIIKSFPMYWFLLFVSLLIHLLKEINICKSFICTTPLKSPQSSGEISPLPQLDWAWVGSGNEVPAVHTQTAHTCWEGSPLDLRARLWMQISLLLELITTVWYCLPGSMELHNPGPWLFHES